MIKLKIDRVRNEKPETKEELRDGGRSKLGASANNSVSGAVEKEDVTLREINTWHLLDDRGAEMSKPLRCD